MHDGQWDGHHEGMKASSADLIVCGISLDVPLRKKCPYSEFFWSECGKIRTRKTPNTDTFYTLFCIMHLSFNE